MSSNRIAQTRVILEGTLNSMVHGLWEYGTGLELLIYIYLVS